jgi:hypothetical protein
MPFVARTWSSRIVSASVIAVGISTALTACTSSTGWVDAAPGQHGVDPKHSAKAWPVIASGDFPQSGSAGWELVAVNNKRRKIEFSVEIGDSCRMMRGVTLAETATTVTVGAYVTDATLPAHPGDTGTSFCETLGQVGTGTVTLAQPLGARALLHVPVTEH